jgi:hypothetical protein
MLVFPIQSFMDDESSCDIAFCSNILMRLTESFIALLEIAFPDEKGY